MSTTYNYNNPETIERSKNVPTKDTGSPFKKAIILEMILEPSLITEDKKAYYSKFDIKNFSLIKSAPKNSYIAQIVSTEEDAGQMAQESTYILAPFFPAHIALPCKPGDFVWTFFDNVREEVNFGFWICKITTTNYIEDLNYTHYPRIVDFANIDLNDIERYHSPQRLIFHTNLNKSTRVEFIEKDKYKAVVSNKFEFIKNKKFIKNISDALEISSEFHNFIKNKDVYNNPFNFILRGTDAAKLMSYEAVPSFLKRPGDIVFEGSNNNLVLLGTERNFNRLSLDTNFNITKDTENDTIYEEDNSGTVDILVGIRNKTYDIKRITNDMGRLEREKLPLFDSIHYNGDNGFPIPDLTCTPTFRNTKSRIYVSQNTNPDKILDVFESDYRQNQEAINIKEVENYYDYGYFLYNYNKKIIGTETDSLSAAIIQKSDKIRMVARKDIQIIVKPEDDFLPDDTENYSSITIKSNGDIILKPSDLGFIKIGGEDADKVPLCASKFTIIPATSQFEQSLIKAEPLITDGGQQFGLGVYSGSMPFNTGEKQEIISGSYGIFASRVLIK